MIIAATSAASLALAEGTVPTSSADVYGWKRIDTKNTDPSLYDTINYVEDETCGTVLEYRKQSGRISDSQLGIRQDIPASKLAEGHTYVFEFKYNLQDVGVNYWVRAGFPWSDFTEPASSVDAGKGWKTGRKEVQYTKSKFPDTLPVMIITANAQARFRIADVTLYDKADESKTNLLINGALDETLAEHEKNFLYGWNVRHSGYDCSGPGDAEKATYDTISLYGRDSKYKHVVLIDKQSAKHDNSWKGISQTIPAEKLTPGETYVFACDYSLTADSSYVRLQLGGASLDRVGSNAAGWHTIPEGTAINIEYEYTGGDMTAGIWAINGAAKIYLANMKVYAKNDENKTNLLVNGDFSYLNNNDDNLYSWTISNTAHEEDSVYVIDDASYGKVAVVDKKSHRENDSMLGIRASVSASELIAGHTYVVEYERKLEPTADSYAKVGWASWTKPEYSDPFALYEREWNTGSNEKVYGGSGDMDVWFGLTGAAGKLYIANVRVYDKEDPEKTNLLENGSFEKAPDESVEFVYENGSCTANIISKNETYDIVMVSAIYSQEDGGLEYIMVYPYTVEAKSDMQQFFIYPDVWGSGYETRAYLWRADALTPLAPAIVIE